MHATSSPQNGLAGIILCGGQGARMGQPKEWLECGSETMLERVVRRLADACRPIIVVAGVDRPVPPVPGGVEVVRDPRPNLGPLAGLVRGLESLPENVDRAFLTACDMPFVSSELVRALDRLFVAGRVASIETNGQPHPLAAIYPKESLAIARELLADEGQGPRHLIERIGVQRADSAALGISADDCRRMTWSIDTPEDWDRFLTMSALEDRPDVS